MNKMTKDYLSSLIAMRRHLHAHPELAHKEKETANYILRFLKQFKPDRIIEGIGGNGIAAVYKGDLDGPEILIRCELDALPIGEENTVDYVSLNTGKGHLCGHDGHMTMVAGLAPLLSAEKLSGGSVVLLFQPAEETGEGAKMVIQDEKFRELKPDYVFALHNLPGYTESTIITKKGIFASASKGLIIKLDGASSHAAHPEGGNNPAVAAAILLQAILNIPNELMPMHESCLITPIHLRVGQPAFGTSPGDGELMFTIRAHSNTSIELLEKKILKRAISIAKSFDLSYSVEWTEPFDAVANDEICVDMIEATANELGFKTLQKDIPFAWSEDFGVFTTHFRGALFGIGAGENSPQLHNEKYNFPDKIIETGTMMFYSLIKKIVDLER